MASKHTPWKMPLFPQALAIANSPSAWMSFAIAAGLTNSGSSVSIPSSLVFVSTDRTFLKTLGRSHMRSKQSLFASLVIRSVEALE